MEITKVLEKFASSSIDDIINVPLDKNVELGLDVAAGVSTLAFDFGSYKLLSKLVAPVIDAETRVPVKIAYKATTLVVSGVLSNGVKNYVASIFTNVKTGLKAKKIIDKIKEEENGTTTEQVCEAE